MKVDVKLLNGRVIEFEIQGTDKIMSLKQKLEESEGISVDQIRLVYSGRQLPDDKTFEEMKVKEKSVINMLLSLRGGN